MPSPASGRHQHVQVDADDSPLPPPSSSSPANSSFSSLPSSRHLLLSMNHDVDDDEYHHHHPHHHHQSSSTHRGSSTGTSNGSAPLHHAGLANGKRSSMGSSRTSPGGGGSSSSGRPNGRQGAHQSHHGADSSNGLSSLDSHGLHDRDMNPAELIRTSPRHHAQQKLTHQDGMHSSNSTPSAEQTQLPRRSERLRYSNGHNSNNSNTGHGSSNSINGSISTANPQYGSPTYHSERNSYPSRRLSASIHPNNASPSSPSSISTGSSSPTASGASTSTPTSPSQYALPYSHSSSASGHHSHRDKDEVSSGTADLLYSSTSASTIHQPNGRSRTRSKSHPELPNIPLLQSSRSASVGCSAPMATLFLISMALLGCIFHSNFYRQVDGDNCEFTYMQPKYFKLLGFDRERTAFAGKYGLLLFRDRYDYEVPVPSHMLKEYTNNVYTIDKEAKVRPLGIPALFIPGNAGSAKQVRSIAKEASRYYYETYLPERLRIGSTMSRPIDFFTVDFNEEFSALHGHSLMEQAQFLNDAIAYILSLYEDNRSLDPNLPRPTSVLILGHSMGGVVARSLFTMKNYKPGSVNTIVTAATPHMVPPVTLDFEITNIYNTIENYWIKGFLGPDAPLRNVSLVSIAGGNLDIVVNGDSGNIHNLVPQTNGFSVFTSSFPHAWVGADHVAILWCNQIATVIGKTLIDIVDASYSEQVKPLQERMKIFRNRFLTGIEDHVEKATYPSDTETIELAAVDYTMVDPKHPLVYPPKNSASHDVESANPHFYVIHIPVGSNVVDTFNLITDYSLEVGSRLETLLCVDETTDSYVSTSSTVTTPSVLSCRHHNLSAIPIPASPVQPASSSQGTRYIKGQEFRFISQKLSEIKDAHYVVIKDLGRKAGETGFVIAEFGSEKNSTLTVPTSTLNLWSNGFRMHAFPERPSLVSTLRFPNIDNSLLTYTLTVERQGCRSPQKFAPMMRRSSWLMYEDRYTPNVADRESVDINFHGDVPYFERIQLPGKKGIELRFWMDPSCPVQLSLNMQVDRYGSMGKVMIRYRMVVLVFTYLVVILTLRAQFRAWNRGEPFKPFGMMITQLIQTTFWKFSLLLAVIAFLQSLQSRTVVSFDPILSSGSGSRLTNANAEEEILYGPGGPGGRYPTFPGSREGLGQDAYERMVRARIARNESWFSSFRIGDVLLGANDPFFWFLAPVFFQISIGIVILIWMLLNGLVRSVAALLTCVSKRGGRYAIGQTIGNMLSKRSRGVRRRVITTIILFIMVATFVPYQFAFVVAVLVHIVSCVRSLLTAQKASTSRVQAAWDRYHYLMSIFVMFFLLLPCTLPVLMVWIRNLSVQWYEPFSSDHRLDYIAPFIFFVEAITDGAMIPRTPEKGYAAITMGILNYIIFFLILFGVRYSWQIFFMSRIWIIWLLILQLKDTEMALSLTRTIEHHYSQAFSRPGKKQK